MSFGSSNLRKCIQVAVVQYSALHLGRLFFPEMSQWKQMFTICDVSG